MQFDIQMRLFLHVTLDYSVCWGDTFRRYGNIPSLIWNTVVINYPPSVFLVCLDDAYSGCCIMTLLICNISHILCWTSGGGGATNCSSHVLYMGICSWDV